MDRRRKKRKTFEEDNGFAQFGGYMAAKKSKLSRQFDSKTNSSTSSIFSGVSIHVNGYTTPTADELKALMAEHGGAYHHYYSRSKTTHIIASILPHTKIKNLKDEKVVKPDWITDSIKAGKLLSYTNYLLYNPRILQGQTKLGFVMSENDNEASSSSLHLYQDSSSLEDSGTSKDLTSVHPSCSNMLVDVKQTSASYISRSSSESSQSKSSLKLIEVCDPVLVTVSSDTTSNSDPSSVHILEELEEATVQDSNSDKENPDTSKVLETGSENKQVPNLSSPSKTTKAGKAGDANFLSEFYSHSRLHHISTAGAEFKDYVRQLQTQHTGDFPGRDLLRKEIEETFVYDPECLPPNQKVFMHIDMDCFFVSVGLLKRPDLIGKPVAVTHSRGNPVPQREGVDVQFEIDYYKNRAHSGRGNKTNSKQAFTEDPRLPVDYQSKETLGSTSEISSCSYEARKAGVSSGMFLGEALKRCPDLQTIPYDFEGYTRVSKLLYETLVSYTLQVEAISCDEMFVDCSEVLEACGASPLKFAEHIRTQILAKTGCTASAGLGSNLLIARLATRLAKPNGRWYVPPEENSSFMVAQKVQDLPGVGHSLGSQLKSLGVQNCGQLQDLSVDRLQREFGNKTGKTLYDQCRGIDNRTIVTEKERKSVSAEINYGMRFQKIEEAEGFLKELAGEVEKRLKKAEKIGSHITLKLKLRSKDAPMETAKFLGHGVCDNVTRSFQLPMPVDSGEVIGRECCSILKTMKVVASDIRGMGIQVGRLSSAKAKQHVRTIEDFLFNQPSTSKAGGVVLENQTTGEEAQEPSSVTPRTLRRREIKHDWFPSPSQIDPEVWLALPKDIQSQLASEYKDLNLDFVAVSSKASVSSKANTSTKANTRSSDVKVALPHFSQLDTSVMDALPDDIRHELLEAYSNQGVKMSETPKKGKGKKSPVKSPGRKRPYRRRLPVSPNSKRQVKTRKNQEKVVSPTKPVPVVAQMPLLQKEIFKATLCGATELVEVRPLMKEWIFSTQSPIEDDIELFIKYIRDVILEKNLEKLDLILKSFFRNICNSKNKEWEHVYHEVVNDMQPRIKEMYGHLLRVPCFQ